MSSLIPQRQVTVYNTVGQNEKTVPSTAGTWGSLQMELREAGVSYNGMKAVVGETQVTLESGDAQLPHEDFTLFLLPTKVRSGSDDDDWNWDEVKEEELVFDDEETVDIDDEEEDYDDEDSAGEGGFF